MKPAGVEPSAVVAPDRPCRQPVAVTHDVGLPSGNVDSSVHRATKQDPSALKTAKPIASTNGIAPHKIIDRKQQLVLVKKPVNKGVTHAVWK